MKRKDYLRLALLMAATGTVLAATPVRAEDGPPPMEGPGGMRHGGPGEMFKRADENGDGFLTKGEMLKAHEARVDKMFAELDTDKDGKLSQDEMKAGREKMREKMRERMKDRHGGMGGGPGGQSKPDSDVQ